MSLYGRQKNRRMCCDMCRLFSVFSDAFSDEGRVSGNFLFPHSLAPTGEPIGVPRYYDFGGFYAKPF